MIKIRYKKALALWFCFSAGIALIEVFRNGGDALIINIITPAYWMLCMIIFLIFNSEKDKNETTPTRQRNNSH